MSRSNAYIRCISQLGPATVVGDLTTRTTGPELEEYEATARLLELAPPTTVLKLADMHPLMPAETKAVRPQLFPPDR